MAGLLEACILMLGVVDPLASMAAFASMTKGIDSNEKLKVAVKGVLVAALVFYLFAIVGQNLLDLLGVQINSFKAAGGILLILLGVQMSLGISFPKDKDEVSDLAVVIGTPLITGPATITTTIILVSDIGLPITAIAGALALAVTFFCLVLATRVTKIVGKGGIRVIATMMGIITIAWGLQFLLSGINVFKAG